MTIKISRDDIEVHVDAEVHVHMDDMENPVNTHMVELFPDDAIMDLIINHLEGEGYEITE